MRRGGGGDDDHNDDVDVARRRADVAIRYWMGKEQKLLRFDEKDPDLEAMHEALWTIGDLSRGATHEDTRTLRQYLADEGVSDRAIGMAEAGNAHNLIITP